jgi:hypothetical protein
MPEQEETTQIDRLERDVSALGASVAELRQSRNCLQTSVSTIETRVANLEHAVTIGFTQSIEHVKSTSATLQALQHAIVAVASVHTGGIQNTLPLPTPTEPDLSADVDGWDSLPAVLPEKLGFPRLVVDSAGPTTRSRRKGKGAAAIVTSPRKLTARASRLLRDYNANLPERETIFRKVPPGQGHPYAIRRRHWDLFLARFRTDFDVVPCPDGRLDFSRRMPAVPSGNETEVHDIRRFAPTGAGGSLMEGLRSDPREEPREQTVMSDGVVVVEAGGPP